MTIDSKLFVAVLSVIVVVGLVLCTVALSYTARPGRSHCSGQRFCDLARRVSVALIAGILVIVLFSAGANVVQGWVKRPSDIAGLVSYILPWVNSNNQSVKAKEVPAIHAENLDNPWTDKPLPADVTPTPDDNQSAASLVQIQPGLWQGQAHGFRSDMTREVTVWTPPDFDPNAGITYNVVVFLHGFPGSNQGPVEALNVPNNMTALIKHQLIHPTIFVVPDLSVESAPPDCVDIEGRPNIETYVTQDLVAILRGKFPNLATSRKGWALAGISAGAYCAPVLAMRHPDTFEAALAMGGYDRPDLGTLSEADWKTQKDFTVSVMLKKTPVPTALFVAGTSEDPDSEVLIKRLSAVASPRDSLATFLQPSGGHSWPVWAEQFPLGLLWWQSDGQVKPDEGRVEVTAIGITVASGQGGGARASTIFGLTRGGTISLAVIALVTSCFLSAWLVPTLAARSRLRTAGQKSVGEKEKGCSSFRCSTRLVISFTGRFLITTIFAVIFACAAVVLVNWASGFCDTWEELALNVHLPLLF